MSWKDVDDQGALWPSPAPGVPTPTEIVAAALAATEAPLSADGETSSVYWQTQGSCAVLFRAGVMRVDEWFPERGAANGFTLAKKVCRGCEEDGIPACPVRTECLDWALEHREKHGIWGGLSERERRKAARLRKARELTCKECGDRFMWVPAGGHPPKYCNDECRHEARLRSARDYNRSQGAA